LHRLPATLVDCDDGDGDVVRSGASIAQAASDTGRL